MTSINVSPPPSSLILEAYSLAQPTRQTGTEMDRPLIHLFSQRQTNVHDRLERMKKEVNVPNTTYIIDDDEAKSKFPKYRSNAQQIPPDTSAYPKFPECIDNMKGKSSSIIPQISVSRFQRQAAVLPFLFLLSFPFRTLTLWTFFFFGARDAHPVSVWPGVDHP